eukprot:scaffold656_cov271-Chaetoceros_neogracile.AAC.95
MQNKNEHSTAVHTACSCGPYPSLDLTKAFNSNEDDLKDLKNEAIAACERFGCFHVTISPSEIDSDCNDMNILSNSDVVKQSFDRIFDDDFIRRQTERNAIASVPSRMRDGSATAAKYRGRAAESGSTTGLEPKRSWEVFRCRKGLSNTLSSEPPCDELSILHDYARVFHEVTVCLFSKVLDLPENFVDANTCKCNCTQSDECLCTMDLLRAFQYDALKNSDIAEANLGSSPHTDWGSLTVVWQDSKGGLQIYCHEHEKWNNVEVPDEIRDGTVRLFIHVGDFTSLALSQTLSSSEQVIWPSPLHRVICPLQPDKPDAKTANDTRCSLVYFAYPPKGCSLDDSQRYVRNQMGVGKKELNKVEFSSFPYDRYMVLNDQSPESGTAPSKEEVFHRIQKIPFHKVIEAKWQEVQRT